MPKTINVGKEKMGGGRPFILIAGPCVIENKATVFKIAEKLDDMTRRLNIPFVFKASYDKANRTSLSSYRGPGIDKGLAILKEVKKEFNVPVLTDVHCVHDVDKVAQVADIIQIPAFLCRQTDLLVKVARTGKVVNIKKGQFMAPWDMKAAVNKVTGSGNSKVVLTDRGTTFGYNNLVSDFRSLAIMRKMCPVIFDATHSVQQPGGLGDVSGGQREFVPLLARSAVAAGCDGIFMEVHTNPKKALSDGPNMLAVSRLEDLLVDLIAIDTVVKRKKCK
ncbi:MAG: 3-deoxy-8-phosphooctulonate synthase [Candidatus Omnitrophica bacterium]|nr:3-deoxy-8-phosphooctulonate synthase [Candidatus Omnitrophota bacterium]